MTYNVHFDSIFPDGPAERAAKFRRVVQAVQPDVLALQEIRKPAAAAANVVNEALPLPGGGKWNACKGWTNVTLSRFPLSMTLERTDPPGERELCIAMVDLPNDRFPIDLYLMNNHFKCCGDTKNDPLRQKQSDAIVNWIRDVRTPGGKVDLPEKTALIICGDLNIVGARQPLDTLLTGDIQDEQAFGPDLPPDWDDSPLSDVPATHNAESGEVYTWRDDTDQYPPGRLDYVIYSDSVLTVVHSFVLDTLTMSEAMLKETGLDRLDCALDSVGKKIDHLPVVVDFRAR